MVHRIPDELARAIEEHGGSPLYLEDGANHRYVLLPLEQFDRLETLVQADDVDAREMYPLVDAVMKEDWDDPAMDVYDDYDAHRSAQ